jgi:serine/threonine protein kinase
VSPPPEWKLRSSILKDVSEGMLYLHSKHTQKGQPKAVVFNQDLRSSNIMLVAEFDKQTDMMELRAKISDFGFSDMRDTRRNARNFETSSISAVTHR